jgi:hypothetical protein
MRSEFGHERRLGQARLSIDLKVKRVPASLPYGRRNENPYVSLPGTERAVCLKSQSSGQLVKIW